MQEAVKMNKFIVNERPYCQWEFMIDRSNERYISSINSKYFGFLSELYFNGFKETDDEEEKHFYAIALRWLYSHGLETLFALISASLQAPQCIPGWMIKYKLEDIDCIIKKINDKTEFLSWFLLKNWDWEEVAQLIFRYSKRQVNDHKKQFAKCWRILSKEFIDDKNRKEYNSLKHGFRNSAGGFSIGLQPINKDGGLNKNSPSFFAGGKYGSSFFVAENINNNKINFRLRRFGNNWEPERFFHTLKIIYMSIENVKQFLKNYNKYPNSKKYILFSDINSYDEPWRHLSSVTNSVLDFKFSEEFEPNIEPQEIIQMYKNLKKPKNQ